MKDFNFKEKEVVKDEDLLKYKNFNEVIQKHQTITKSYHTIRIIWGGIGLAAIIGLVTLYNFSDEIVLPKPIHLTKVNNVEIHQPESIQVIETKITNEGKVKISSPIEVKPPTLSKNVVVPKEGVVKNRSIEMAKKDTVVKTQKRLKTIDEYYHLQQKTIEERIKLPTLFLAGKSWPSIIRKRDLIKQSNLTAAYIELNKEVPIISYSMMRVDPNDFEKGNNKIINRDGRYSAAILRESHRSKSGEFIIYKNIIVFVPGVGRVNMGDLKVEVTDDKTYNKRLRERKSITQ
jgi:hypothetical protein